MDYRHIEIKREILRRIGTERRKEIETEITWEREVYMEKQFSFLFGTTALCVTMKALVFYLRKALAFYSLEFCPVMTLSHLTIRTLAEHTNKVRTRSNKYGDESKEINVTFCTHRPFYDKGCRAVDEQAWQGKDWRLPLSQHGFTQFAYLENDIKPFSNRCHTFTSNEKIFELSPSSEIFSLSRACVALASLRNTESISHRRDTSSRTNRQCDPYAMYE
ncbi:hypothetical protein Scep_027984 [Stephania cephalantha]|uniref:Uncharacterized protein n=1 Tax=Stephania cephalantha TaxID=152367 RepID=A0AAP0HLC0_9MAGN